MVADASEVTFAKVCQCQCCPVFPGLKELFYSQHYGTIMPLLLNVLRNATDPSHHKLRVKAMECAGLIGMFLIA